MAEPEGRADQTAVRVALWRAMHLLVDPPPHVLEDEIGLRLAGPPDGWRDRGDMHPEGTRTFRASVLARSRFVEDLLIERADNDVTQYVLLGAGLDTFVQRRPEVAARLQVFEIDQPGAQAWKRQRLTKLGYGIPAGLHLVGDDFETDGSWWRKLTARGARASGTPFISFFSPTGILELAREAGFAQVRHVPAAELNQRYFGGRDDGLRTSSGEELLVATT
jgi:methyltransferase (TIGR00027 family)